MPTTTAWITYLRCHDDIGWAIDDADAAAVGLSGFGHRAFLSDFYTGEFPGSFAPRPGVPGQPGHRRPADQRHDDGARRPRPRARAGDPAAVDLAVAADPARARDRARLGRRPGALDGRRARPARRRRLGVRARPRGRQPVGAPAADVAAAVQAARHEPRSRSPRGCSTACGRSSRARRALPHLHASVAARVLDPVDPGVLAGRALAPGGRPASSCSTSPTRGGRTRARHTGLDVAGWHDVLADGPVHPGVDGDIWLPPYGAMWLVRE